MADDLDVQALAGAHRDALDDQHATRRVVVVGQRLDDHGTVGRQQGEVVLGRGPRVGLLRIGHVDADLPLGRVGAVADGVDDRLRADLRRRELQGVRRRVALDRDLGGGGADLDEAEFGVLRVGVVGQRRERHSLPDGRRVVVVVRDGSPVAAAGGDLDGELLGRGDGAVADGDRHGPAPRAAGAEIPDGDESVGAPGHGDAVTTDGVGEEDRVAVRIAPVGQRGVVDGGALRHAERVLALTHRRFVGLGLPDGDVDGGGVAEVDAVGGLVGERDGTRLVCRDLDPGRAAVLREGDGDIARDVAEHRGQNVAVGVEVVEEDGQGRGRAGAGAQLVVLRDRRVLLLGELLELGFLGLVGVLLLLLLLLLGDLVGDEIPVVDALHRLAGQEQGAGGEVVDHDRAAVHPEGRLGGGRQLGEARSLDGVRIAAVAHVVPGLGPQPVRAALEPDGSGGTARRDVGDLGVATAQRDAQQRVGRGDQRDGGGAGGVLEHALAAEVDLASGGLQDLAVERHQRVADDGQRGVLAQRAGELAVLLDRSGLSGADDRPDDAVSGDDEAGAVGADGDPGMVKLLQRGLGRGAEPPCLRSRAGPHLAGVRVSEEDEVAAVDGRQADGGGLARERDGGRVEWLQQVGAADEHMRAELRHIRVRGECPETAVQGLGVVVQVAHQAQRCIRHPDAAVVQFKVDGRNSLVCNCQAGQ